jgi:hypothetical protein
VHETIARFLIGGVVVTAFSISGELFRPRSFAGLFGAAPSVAVATLALTSSSKGQLYAAVEARSMVAGAVALCLYSLAVAWILMRGRLSTRLATLSCLAVWFGVAFGLWFAFLRHGQ